MLESIKLLSLLQKTQKTGSWGIMMTRSLPRKCLFPPQCCLPALPPGCIAIWIDALLTFACSQSGLHMQIRRLPLFFCLPTHPQWLRLHKLLHYFNKLSSNKVPWAISAHQLPETLFPQLLCILKPTPGAQWPVRNRDPHMRTWVGPNTDIKSWVW